MRRELDSLVTQMHSSGMRYEDAVSEFKKQYLREVLVNDIHVVINNKHKAANNSGIQFFRYPDLYWLITDGQQQLKIATHTGFRRIIQTVIRQIFQGCFDKC